MGACWSWVDDGLRPRLAIQRRSVLYKLILTLQLEQPVAQAKREKEQHREMLAQRQGTTELTVH